MSSFAITDEELTALSEELAALTRAGVPLELGLVGLGGDFPGRLGKRILQIATSMQQGKSLPEASADSSDRLTQLFCAVVEAGSASGRLSQVLELFAKAGRRVAEVRMTIGAAMLYPMLVLCVSYVFTMIAFFLWTPTLLTAFDSLEISPGRLAQFHDRALKTSQWWAPILPVAMIFLASAWFRSARNGRLSKGIGSIVRRIPGLGELWTAGERAIFAELVALLLDQHIPYPRALELAGHASADPSLQASCAKLGLTIQEGRSAEEPTFPPLLRWALSKPATPSQRVATLRRAANVYHEEARRRAESLRTWAPVMLLLVLGGISTAVFAILVFAPLGFLLESMGKAA